MALQVSKSTTLTGESVFDGKTALRMTAALSTEQNNYVNQTIMDNETYLAHKKDVRKDISDFQNLVYEEQDYMDGNNAYAKPSAEVATSQDTAKTAADTPQQ